MPGDFTIRNIASKRPSVLRRGRACRKLHVEALETRDLLAVVFSTGAGTAVDVVDRAATFDGGSAIDVLNYTEDMLAVTTPSGVIAAQPGPFDPFTAVAPGISGYYAVSNSSYVSIRPTDAAPMAAIEFTLGDLFGAGPGQPPDPRSTNLVWETYRDGVLSGSGRSLQSLRAVVAWADSSGMDELRVGASGFPSFTTFGSSQAIALDDLKVQIDSSGSVAFGTGAGSAVNIVDRSATFDAGNGIDVSHHLEDMLLIASAEGSIATQPGAFSPFTAVAPGVSGYFGVASNRYVSISAADSAVITGIEFKLGDLFGAGPGQPPDPRNTFLIWESFRDGQRTGMNTARLGVGTIVTWADPTGIEELRVGASGFPSFTKFGEAQAIALDDLKVQIDTSSDVRFSAGEGSSLVSVDRLATFDAGGGIQVSDYSEDDLSITTSAGAIPPQPGAFSPFTATQPGVSGYYAVSNSTFVAIRPVDASPMTGVEFELGDLWGVGPGQPPNPFSTFLVWETYRDGVKTGEDRAQLAVGTTVTWTDTQGIDELRVGASGFSDFTGFGAPQRIALDNLKVQLESDGDVQFLIGAGSAVTAADRTATFDAGGAIDVRGHSEDGLFVASDAGAIAAQPGSFNPFTGTAPGASGYYAVANSTYVSIRPADDRRMTGIELLLGDLFGDGPGRPPDPFGTYLVWETYRDGVRTGIDRTFLADGTIVGWADPLGIDELRFGASGFPNFTGFGIDQAIAIDDLAVQLKADVAGLSVSSFASTSTGFRAELSAELETSLLNIFATEAVGLGPADVTVRGAAHGMVSGSLVVEPSARVVTFVATGGALAPDSYTVVLRSAADGFASLAGPILDGNGDGIPGDDFTAQFTIVGPPSDSVTIGLVDLVRGPGQDLNFPANGSDGIPITLNHSTAVQNVRFQLSYEPDLLTITGASVAADMPAGTAVELELTAPGLATLTFSSPVELAGGDRPILNLQATVPADNAAETLGRAHVLDLHSVVISNAVGDQFPVIANDGLHHLAYFADVSGNRRINAIDAALLARFVALIDQGFGTAPLIDPVIVGDISGNGRINAADASRVAQFAALIDVPEIPAIPSGILAAGWLAGTPQSPRLREPLQDFTDDMLDLVGGIRSSAEGQQATETNHQAIDRLMTDSPDTEYWDSVFPDEASRRHLVAG